LDVRPTRADDPQVRRLLEALDDYLAGLYPPDANHILGIDELLAPEVTFLAAWCGERVVGCGAVRRVPGEPATASRPYGEIKRMMVAPAQRGARIGERLLMQLEQRLAADGIGLSLLETGRDQHAAVRLYERCGYRPRGAFGGYPDNGLSVFYEKQLT
jgi:putative acetyltransferase